MPPAPRHPESRHNAKHSPEPFDIEDADKENIPPIDVLEDSNHFLSVNASLECDDDDDAVVVVDDNDNDPLRMENANKDNKLPSPIKKQGSPFVERSLQRTTVLDRIPDIPIVSTVQEDFDSDIAAEEEPPTDPGDWKQLIHETVSKERKREHRSQGHPATSQEPANIITVTTQSEDPQARSKHQDAHDMPQESSSAKTSSNPKEDIQRALDEYYRERAAREEQLQAAWLTQFSKRVVINDKSNEIRFFSRTPDEQSEMFPDKRTRRRVPRRSKYSAATSLADQDDHGDAAKSPEKRQPSSWTEELQFIFAAQLRMIEEGSCAVKNAVTGWTENFLEDDQYQYQRDLLSCKSAGGCTSDTNPGSSPTSTMHLFVDDDLSNKDDSSICSAPQLGRAHSDPLRIMSTFSCGSDSSSVQSESGVASSSSYRRSLRRKKNHHNDTIPSRRPDVSHDFLIEAGKKPLAPKTDADGVTDDVIEISLIEGKRPVVPVQRKRQVVASARRWAAASSQQEKMQKQVALESMINEKSLKKPNLSIIEEGDSRNDSLDSILDLFRPWNSEWGSSNETFHRASNFFKKLEATNAKNQQSRSSVAVSDKSK